MSKLIGFQKILMSSALCATMVACGGGGGSGDDNPGLPANVTFSGSVVDQSDAPLAGVTIELGFRSDVEQTQTNARGQYSIQIPRSLFGDTDLNEIAVSGSKEGYRNWSYIYTEADQGSPDSLVFNVDPAGVMSILEFNEILVTPMSFDGPIMHLGDGVISDQGELIFQTDTQGTVGFYQFELTEELLAGYSIIQVTFMSRNVESERWPDHTILLQELDGPSKDASPLDEGVSLPNPSSTADGQLTPQSIEYDLADFPGTTGHFRLTFESVPVEGIVTLDDFEITDVLVTLF